MSGRDSGGDLFDMAKDGTSVPSDAAVPRIIPSKPGAADVATERDANDFGSTNLADAATNATDIPRTVNDQADPSEIVTAAGGAIPSHAASKRTHPVPGGTTHDPGAKGGLREERRGKQDADLDRVGKAGGAEGLDVDVPPGMEDVDQETLKNQVEQKQVWSSA